MKANPKKPLVMGILNVTPDSFSDGGRYLSREAACQQADQLVEEGADIIDIGGESTRPGSQPVSVNLELERVIPVVAYLHGRTLVKISVDTNKPEVAEVAAKAGAHMINDITGGSEAMARFIAAQGLEIVLMHMQGTPTTMQIAPIYAGGVVEAVRAFLGERVELFLAAGVPFERIWVDPGIGFGKTVEHNLQLLANLDRFLGLGDRLLVGTSRKSFLSVVGKTEPKDIPAREAGTLASNLWAYQKGASVFRVHQVAELKRALRTWDALGEGGNLK